MQQPDGKPGLYYVTAINHNKKVALLVGPFVQEKPGTLAHSQALGQVWHARSVAQRLFPGQTSFCTWGTTRVDLDHFPGEPPVGKLGRNRVTIREEDAHVQAA